MNKVIKVTASARATARKVNLANLGAASFNVRKSEGVAVAALKVTLGNVRPPAKGEKLSPVALATFNEARHTFQTGYMAYLLFADSNQPIEALLIKARLARDSADADGKGNLKVNQTRRRTKVEQAAYAGAKVAWSRILKVAGLVTVEKRGGKAPTPKAPDKAPEKGATVPAAVAAKYMPPKSADKETATAYVRQQLKMLSTFIEAANQRAMKATGETLPVAICSAVEDCCKAVAAVK